jgi:hypothetical protein
MDISSMHTYFRQYAQQMGLQNVRAILPEQIDIVLNTSIQDTVNQLVQATVGLTNDRVLTDNSKIGQLNALRSLYKVLTINVLEKEKDSSDYPFKFHEEDSRNGLFTGLLHNVDVRFWVDFSIRYTRGIVGITENSPGIKDDTNKFVTNWFPVRLIDDIYLADSLNDFIQKNRLRSPIMVVYNAKEKVDDKQNINGTKSKIAATTFELYIDKLNKNNNDSTYYLDNRLIPYQFRMGFVANPVEVKYDEDVAGNNVDCDLPEYMHVDIVKHAVDLYRIAVSGSLYAGQQQQEAQQRENYRNNNNADNTNQ